MAGIGSGLGILLLYAVVMQGFVVPVFMYVFMRCLCCLLMPSFVFPEFHTFVYVSFLRVLLMRRIFQVVLYAGFMRHI